VLQGLSEQVLEMPSPIPKVCRRVVDFWRAVWTFGIGSSSVYRDGSRRVGMPAQSRKVGN
jgi:hypothetical protein